jgi:type IV secretion system protein VirB2
MDFLWNRSGSHGAWQGFAPRFSQIPDFAGGDSVTSVLGSSLRRAAGVTAAFWSAAAHAQDQFADPSGSGPLISAVHWLQGTLLGTIATVAAVIAVAAVGFMMLTGRLNWRYGATVILGCFILFGAASIVAGIQSTAQLGG